MPGSTDYRPGVGIVLVNDRGLVFAGQRADGRQPPWQMPQGGILMGEPLAEAAFRELAEELGTDKAVIIDVHPRWRSYDYPDGHSSRRAAQYRGQRHRWFLMRFIGCDADIDIFTAHGEFSAWRWMEPSAVAAAVAAFKQPVYRDVLAHFAPLLHAHRQGATAAACAAFQEAAP